MCRTLLTGGLLGLTLLFAAATHALTMGDAEARVRAAIADIAAVMSAGADRARTAASLETVMRTHSEPAVLARYSAGDAWPRMSSDQQARFTEALTRAVADTYAGQMAGLEVRAEDVSGAVHLTRTVDAGAKGQLVESEIRPPGLPAISMDFLVSDRPGRIVIVDIIVEGISMARTQREIVQAMIVDRGGDLERLIADL